MGIVLKNLTTGLYLKNGVSWTSDVTEALRFDSIGRAQRFCTTHRFTDCQPVPLFREENSEQDKKSIAA